jgi:hypothetical protein
MFGLAAFAMPLVGQMLGGILGGLANQGGHGCHGHHHHHDHNNLREAAQDFRMAQQDYRDAQRNFSQGDFFGGVSELISARQHESDGFSHLSGGRGWIKQPKQAVFPQRPQAGATRLAARFLKPG